MIQSHFLVIWDGNYEGCMVHGVYSSLPEARLEAENDANLHPQTEIQEWRNGTRVRYWYRKGSEWVEVQG